jgi:DNA-binding NarL/FixJ family response regulator
MTTCLICDDHPLVRTALADMLGRILPGAEILQARDFRQGMAIMAERQPDLCLTDLGMPGAGPLAGVQMLRAASPGTPLLVVSGSEDDDALRAVLGAGVAGFLDKTADLPVAAAAVQLVLSGGQYLPPRILSLLAMAVPAHNDDRHPAISLRQAEVLDLVAQGMGNKDIARELDVAPSTVKTHLEQSMRRLGAENRMQAAQVWIRMRATG